MAALTARRVRSCQYRTGPDEAGRNGRVSLLDGPRRLFRARPKTPLPSIPSGYPGQQELFEIGCAGVFDCPAGNLTHGCRDRAGRRTAMPAKSRPSIGAQPLRSSFRAEELTAHAAHQQRSALRTVSITFSSTLGKNRMFNGRLAGRRE